MSGKELIKLGFKPGPAIGVAIRLASAARQSMDKRELKQELKAVLQDPAAHVAHPQFGEVAQALLQQEQSAKPGEREQPAPYQVWGEGLDSQALDQMKVAVRLPVAVCGALMPDAHVGYGLPIGGVLATDNAVIPYAVGVDIACRMKLSVFDIPARELKRLNGTLVNA